jgi:hypothetical protein
MRWIIVLFFFAHSLLAQFTYSGYVYSANGGAAINVPVKLYKRTTTTSGNNSTSVKVYRTHYGTGNTSQYATYPSTRSEMDRCFNTGWAATTLWSTVTMSGNSSLNFGAYTTLTSAGASVPSSGDYYATEVTFTFTPLETGSYSFGMTSDDGSDLWLVNTGSIIEYYGGKGVGAYKYGSVSLTAGTSYTFIARMQEYAGGDGLYLIWKRPSQSTWSYQSAEIGTVTTTVSSWTLDATVNTNSTGYYSFSRPTTASTEWYIQVDAPTRIQAYTNTDIQAVSNIILGKSTINGLSYHRFDLNDDGRLTIADKYYVAARKSGRFTRWRIAPDVRIFTTSEYNTISSSTANVRTTYPGVSSYSTSTLTSGGTLNLYLIAPGYSGAVTY